MVETCGISGRRGPTCPRTGRATRPVARWTVLNHVVPPEVPETAFGFCDVPNCEVVYVGSDGTLFTKAALRTRVGLKERTDPIPICYCFSFTERQIAGDVRAHGHSTIRDYIQEQVRAGRCACETTNPSGRCCLGDVAGVIARSSDSRRMRRASRKRGTRS